MTLTVNGEEIRETEIREEMERIRSDYERVFQDMDPVLREAQLLEWSRENVIERKLIQQEALSDSEDISEKKVASTLRDLKKQHGGEKKFYQQLNLSQADEPVIKEDIHLQLKVERLIERVRSQTPEPTEDEIREYYETNTRQYMAPEQVHAAHIVKHIQQSADEPLARKALQEARQKLENGADFIETAAEYSDCPPNEVDLGYFPRGRMVERFENVVFGMEPGDVSDIFSTEYGMHITKVFDRKQPEKYPLEQVREDVVKELTEEKKKEAVEKYIDGLKNQSVIKDE
ncbi:MAG TPA: peptidylprolyl isomerase [bacterium]|nr:peptidylprolyl isomerase [bacterium]